MQWSLDSDLFINVLYDSKEIQIWYRDSVWVSESVYVCVLHMHTDAVHLNFAYAFKFIFFYINQYWPRYPISHPLLSYLTLPSPLTVTVHEWLPFVLNFLLAFNLLLLPPLFSYSHKIPVSLLLMYQEHCCLLYCCKFSSPFLICIPLQAFSNNHLHYITLPMVRTSYPNIKK